MPRGPRAAGDGPPETEAADEPGAEAERPLPEPLPVDPVVAAAIAAILDEPRRVGESASETFRRKEHALGALFLHVAPSDALALHRRFVCADPDDALAHKFARLVVERRQRLLAFLTEVRRRAAR